MAMALIGNQNPQAQGALANGTQVHLRRDEAGFVEGGPGTPYWQTAAATTQATIVASEGNTIPRWPGTPQGPAGREYRYKLQIALQETYEVIIDTGAPIPTERKGGLIPHSNLSATKYGRQPIQTTWHLGETAYLIARHTYVGVRGASEHIEPGECIRISSGAINRTSLRDTTDPAKAYYSFKRTKESRANKVWTSADKVHEAYIL
ncbi:hypothetical protein CPB84DRAFT_1803528 [Gymnopilus junonius]|uniref:Uncharacterized protein n=1 Tax=Gymnopilus junonius TaxID=109634 RepID=A0A9P5N7H7_GYMJU|nr:hypothetical protein CPB84DRAFT_1803528 [Gymnopilus junonius]